jgi:hypothetical protein
VINLITKNSIEMKIASGLTLKQNLFDGVLNNENGPDVVDFSASGKAQFLMELENIMDGFVSPQPEQYEEMDAEAEGVQLEETFLAIVSDENTQQVSEPETVQPHEHGLSAEQQEKMETMEKVMNHGMDFLAGMFKMATGQDMGFEGKKMEIDKTTGEVVMRFKMPGF